nr:porin [uncultured Roseateles sp.]
MYTNNKAWLAGAVSIASTISLSNHATAQSLVLYGVVDASVNSTKSGAPGSSRVTGLSSGVMTPSLWGLRGKEDLGGGLAAIFQLETGLDADTGAAKPFAGNPSTATPTAPNGTNSTGFNRRSFVGLQGSFGTLTLGRDYTPVYWTMRELDALRLNLYGNMQSLLPAVGGSERWARVSNGLFYTSPTVNGLTGKAVFSLGSESAGGAGNIPRHANEFVGVSAQYATGKLSLNMSLQELKIAATAGTPAAFTGALLRRRDYTLGGRYQFGDITMSSGYWKANAPTSAKALWVGGTITFGQGAFTAQVQQLKQNNPAGAERRGTVIGTGYVHNLSKRTALYATYGRTSNNSTGAFSLVSSDTVVAAGGVGASPSAYGAGVKHSF